MYVLCMLRMRACVQQLILRVCALANKLWRYARARSGLNRLLLVLRTVGRCVCVEIVRAAQMVATGDQTAAAAGCCRRGASARRDDAEVARFMSGCAALCVCGVAGVGFGFHFILQQLRVCRVL